jgi:hypothetical protein
MGVVKLYGLIFNGYFTSLIKLRAHVQTKTHRTLGSMRSFTVQNTLLPPLIIIHTFNRLLHCKLCNAVAKINTAINWIMLF